MDVALIAAVARNGVIGRGGRLPWHLPADLKRFRALTVGHPVVMGRKTFESIGRALPQRTNIVISRNAAAGFAGCRAADSPGAALAACGNAGRVFVIGGGEIYRHFLPLANLMYLTEVDADVDGDAFFPPFDPTQWSVSREVHNAENGLPAFAFADYTRQI